MNITILIPCYNEQDNVARLRRELGDIAQQLGERTAVELLFVDDGSSDDTCHVLENAFQDHTSPNLQVRIERHSQNRGLGAALRTGFSVARGDVIVTTDADGTYAFREIPALLDCLGPEVGIVTASPYHPRGAVANVPPHRLLPSRACSSVYRLLVDQKIYTYTALFRAYRRQVATNTPFDSDDFLAVAQILVNARRAGVGIAEYPTVLHSRVAGVSKARLVRHTRAHLAFQFQLLRAMPHKTRVSAPNE